MNVVVRKARKGELKVVQELNSLLFVHDFKFDSLLNLNWPFEKKGKDYFKDRISGKDGVYLVAELNGDIVGYLAGAMIEPYDYRKIKKQAELENMLIKDDFRGQGVGKKLIVEFVNWSKIQGAERIKVSALTNNIRTIKFYESAGFVTYFRELEYEVKSGN